MNALRESTIQRGHNLSSDCNDLEVEPDLTHFAKMYEACRLSLDELTPHQRSIVSQVRDAFGRGKSNVHVRAPAGAGKTFVALFFILEVLLGRHDGAILFVAPTTSLCYFVVKWLAARVEKQRNWELFEEEILPRIHILYSGKDPHAVKLNEDSVLESSIVRPESRPDRYALVIVDEAHSVYSDGALVEAFVGRSEQLLLLSDLSQALGLNSCKFPPAEEVLLKEVVRCTRRIFEGALCFQLGYNASASISCDNALGPPLTSFIFDGEDANNSYAFHVREAIKYVIKKYPGLPLHDKLAIVTRPDPSFHEQLLQDLRETLKEFRLRPVDAETASRTISDRVEGLDQSWIVVDQWQQLRGLERLIVVAVGLDARHDAHTTLNVRLQLYTAITRAQLEAVVVNEFISGGLLDFLGQVELAADDRNNSRIDTDYVCRVFDDAQKQTATQQVAKALRNLSPSSIAAALCNRRRRDTQVSNASRGKRESAAASGYCAHRRPSEPMPPRTNMEEEKDEEGRDEDANRPADHYKQPQMVWDPSRNTTTKRPRDDSFFPFFITPPGLLAVRQAEATRCISASYQTLKVWDVRTATCLLNLEGHTDWVNKVAASGDERCVSASDDKTLKVWNLRSGECDMTLEGHGGSVLDVAALGGERCISGSGDKTLKVWNLHSGECEMTLEGHSRIVNGVAVLSIERCISASADKTLKVWNLHSGKCDMTLSGHMIEVNGVAALSHERCVSASYDKTLKVWNLRNGKCEMTLEGHTHWVNHVTALSDNRCISASYDDTLKVWDLRNGTCELTLQGHTAYVFDVAAISDERCVSASGDNTLKVWNLRTGNCERTLKGHTSTVYGIAALR